MPSLEQLAQAAVVNPSDLLLLDQNGTSKSVSVNTLQAGLQPKLTLAPGALLGHASPSPGQPEPIGIGSGLVMSAAVLQIDPSVVADLSSPAFTGTPTASTPPAGDYSTRLATTAFVQQRLAQPITLTGDISGATQNGSPIVQTSLATITTPGTYATVNVNAKGQVTGGSVLSTGNAVELQSNKATPGGYASLDSTGKVPTAQLPAAVAGGLLYQGTWDANLNIPSLRSGTGTTGWFYTVKTAGTTSLDGISQWNIGDKVLFNGSSWEKIDGIANEVISVAGMTGAVTVAQVAGALGLGSLAGQAANAVTLTGGSIDGAAIGNSIANTGKFTTLSATAQAIVPTVAATDNSTNAASTAFVKAQGYITSAASLVQSVAGRTGTVTLTVSDITGAAPLASAALTGIPTAPTPVTTDNSTAIATTSFVKAQGYLSTAPVQAVAGQTGNVTAAQLSTALGLGSIASQQANAVAISGGSVNNTTIGSVTPATGNFTTLNVTTQITVPTLSGTDNSTNAASTAYVNSKGYITASGAPVQSVAGRTGSISLAVADVSGAASLASPALTGIPTAPTAAVGTNSTQLATTAFVVGQAGTASPSANGTAAVGTSLSFARQDHVHPTDTTRASLASPALTGVPTAPTAAVGTNSTQLATTAFVVGQAGTATPSINGTAAVGTSLSFARQDHVHPTDTSRAALASPSFTGTPTAPTPATTDNSTTLATTAFVKAQGYTTAASTVTSVAGQTGAVTDLSAGTVKASGGSTARSLSARATDVQTAVDFGADTTGASDSLHALQTLATGMASNGGTIAFTPGVYQISAAWYIQDNTLIEVDGGATFPNASNVNADADGTVLKYQQARKSWLGVTSTDANAFTTFTSLVVSGTSGSTNYEKAAGYDAVLSYDASSYTVGASYDTPIYTKDVVGRQMSAIVNGTTLGRAWGTVAGATALSGADGLLIGAEIDVIAQVSQGEHSRKNSKTGVMAVSMGAGQPTTAFLTAATSAAWFDGYTVLKNTVSRYAFVVRDLSVYPSVTPFSVDPSGNVVVQSLNNAGNQQISGLATFNAGIADASFSSQTPTSGFAITVPNGVLTLQLTPASTLASGTITMPSAPGNGQWLFVTSTQTISSVAFTPATGQSVLAAPSLIPSGVEVAFQYQASAARWICQSGNDSRIANAATAASLTFGTGADGAFSASSGTTTLTRDMHWTSCTLSGSASIVTNGYRVFVSGTLDISAATAGAISCNGNNGSSATSASGAFGPGGFAMRTVGQSPTGGGGGGTATLAAGSAGVAGISNAIGNGGSGGAAGAGGASSGSGGAAGIGGAVGGQIALSTPTTAFFMPAIGVSICAGLVGGGGGGGGGDGTNYGGGGGSGGSFGGTIALYARNIQRGSNTTVGVIQAKGGFGGAGYQAAGGNAAGGGGGGGGGGGFVYIITETLQGNAMTNGIDVSGGNGANGGVGAGTGKGGAGGTGGSSGSVQMINLLAPSYYASSWNIAGANGSISSTTSGGAGGTGAILHVAL